MFEDNPVFRLATSQMIHGLVYLIELKLFDDRLYAVLMRKFKHGGYGSRAPYGSTGNRLLPHDQTEHANVQWLECCPDKMQTSFGFQGLKVEIPIQFDVNGFRI